MVIISKKYYKRLKFFKVIISNIKINLEVLFFQLIDFQCIKKQVAQACPYFKGEY